MTAFNLRAALEPVWRGDAYWARRGRPSTFSNVSAPGVDPDGRVRDMRSDEEAKRWAAERADVLGWLPQGARVYDLGCGDGKLKVARPDLRVWGYDPDEDAFHASERRGYMHVDTGSGNFDALFCCHVVEHMENPLLDVAEALHWCRSGATVVVETPDFGSPVALEWGERFRLLHDPTHVSLFTSESLIRMLRALGVEVLEVAFPGYFGTPLQERCDELFRGTYDGDVPKPEYLRGVARSWSPPAPGNVVAVRGRKR